MGIVIRQSAISTAFTYIGVVVGYVNILLLYPRYMSPDEVGLARIIQDAAMLMVPLAQLGISQVVLRYFPRHRNQKEFPEFVGLVFSLLLLTLLLFTVFFLVFKSPIAGYFSQQSPQVIRYLNYILILVVIMTINQIMMVFCQSSLNIILPNFLKEVALRVFTLAGILLFATGLINFTGFVNLLIGAYLVNLVILTGYLTAKGVLKFSFRRQYFSKATLRQMIKYSLFTFLAASGILIIGKVDSLMVTGMLGLTETAIYTTAFYIAVLIELPKRAVAQISLPVISRAFDSNSPQEIAKIYRQSAINNLIIGLLIFIGLWINLENIYRLIPRSEIYSLGSQVVLIIGAGKLIDMAAGLNGEIIVLSKHYKVNVYLVVGLAVITVIANYLLIPLYGLNGAALGSLIALFIFNLSKFIFLQTRFNMQPFTLNTVKVLVIGGLSLLIGLWLPQLANIYLDILVRSGVVTLVYGLAVYLSHASAEINQEVNKWLNRHT